MRTVSLLLAFVLGSAATGGAAGLPTAKPEDVGLSSARLARITETLKADVERGRIPGAVVVIARRGRIAYAEAVGFRDKAAGAAMSTDAIFRIASMTKPLVSVAIMMLYEDGQLFVNDPISKYIRSMGTMRVGLERLDPMTGKSVLTLVPAEREMTLQDLLRHTSGLTYGNRGTTSIHQAYPTSSNAASRELTSAELIERLAKAPLLFHPGTRWEYGFSTDVLGHVVEIVSGKSLGAFLTERLFEPLKMADTAFWVPPAKRGRLAQALPIDPDTGKAVTIPDVTVPAKFECGGGCAVSTAADYARFAQMLLGRGTLEGTRILGRKTVEYMTADHLAPSVTGAGTYSPGPGYGFGLGFAVRRETGIANLTGTAGDYTWGGAYGTAFWIDPKEQLIVVSMTQAPGAIRTHYRQLLKTLVLQAIQD
jgi:CubicO group peptidase (beta-lactamase class C family)